MTADEQQRLEAAFAALSHAFVRALYRAGVEGGLEPQASERITRQMVTGSIALLRRSARSAADLTAAVTSKGGTTQAGLAVMNRQGGIDAIVAAAAAGAVRG